MRNVTSWKLLSVYCEIRNVGVSFTCCNISSEKILAWKIVSPSVVQMMNVVKWLIKPVKHLKVGDLILIFDVCPGTAGHSKSPQLVLTGLKWLQSKIAGCFWFSYKIDSPFVFLFLSDNLPLAATHNLIN